MKASLSEQSVFIKTKHHIIFLVLFFLCQRSLEKQTLCANKNYLWRVLLSLCCNRGSVLRGLPLHKFYTAVSFVSVLWKWSPGWHKEKNLRRQCSDEGRIKTLLYLRAGEFRATCSADDERETQIDGGTIFSTQPRQQFFNPFRADSTRFLSSSTPSLSHGIGCCICGSSLCEIMERARAVINVFENRSSSDWFYFKSWVEVIVSFIHFVFLFIFLLIWYCLTWCMGTKYPISPEHYSNTFRFPRVHIFPLSRLLAMYALLIDGKISMRRGLIFLYATFRQSH